jgi:hypothetical protein
VGFGAMLGVKSAKQPQPKLMAEQSLDKTQMLLHAMGMFKVRVQVIGFSIIAAGFDSGALGATGPLEALCLEEINTARLAKPINAIKPKIAMKVFD